LFQGFVFEETHSSGGKERVDKSKILWWGKSEEVMRGDSAGEQLKVRPQQGGFLTRAGRRERNVLFLEE